MIRINFNRVDPLFKFDHFIKTRTEFDIQKRIKKLLRVLEKEKEELMLKREKDKKENKIKVKSNYLKKLLEIIRKKR